MSYEEQLEEMLAVARLLAYQTPSALEALSRVPAEIFTAMDHASPDVIRALLSAHADEKFSMLGHETRGVN